MKILKQSTAKSILVGPFLDSTTLAPMTSITVTGIDLDIYKNSVTATNLTITASGGVNDMAHVVNGYYSLELTTGNVDTLGEFIVTANVSGALPLRQDYTVLPANVADSLISTDKLQVDLVETTLTVSEPGGPPNWSSTVIQALSWMLAKSLNKMTSTGTTETLRNSADDATIATASHSDDGTTFTRNIWS